MMKPKIGMCFSGGGYRAATFDLGVMSYLYSVQLEDGITLLDCVVALSSVSGGTIPSMKYMLAKAQGHSVDGMIKDLLRVLCEEDLVDKALKRLKEEKANPNISSIKIMAEIYDSYLFDNKDSTLDLGVIMDNFYRIHVKDYTALATDFQSSLPFRFRLTEGARTRTNKETHPYFGNNDHRINLEDARYITPGEAMACSSCFPSGFEPMMFPDDFKISQLPEAAKYRCEVEKDKGQDPDEPKLRGFGIMDGGIADNQSIESILMAEKFMADHSGRTEDESPMLDLIIVSDVANPYMDGYSPNKKLLPDWLGRLTIGRLRNYCWIAGGVTLACLILALALGSSFWTGFTTVFFVLSLLLNAGGWWLKKWAFKKIAATFVGDRARFVNHVKFSTLWPMLMNRARSIVIMSSEVFLKRMRQLNYGRIYDDERWINRSITNLIYELRADQSWASMTKNGTMPAYLAPSIEIQKNSAKAASMGSTLWFTQEDKDAGMPQALMAAGQYTICFNLLNYIYKIKKNRTNLSSAHQTIIALESKLREDWDEFQVDPLCMVNKIEKK